MNILIYVVQGVCISGTQLSRFAYSKDVKHRKETIVALKELQYFYYSVVMIIQLSILKQRQRRETALNSAEIKGRRIFNC